MNCDLERILVEKNTGSQMILLYEKTFLLMSLMSNEQEAREVFL